MYCSLRKGEFFVDELVWPYECNSYEESFSTIEESNLDLGTYANLTTGESREIIMPMILYTIVTGYNPSNLPRCRT